MFRCSLRWFRLSVAAFANDGGQNNQRIFIDAINATRWDNTSVYTGIQPGQNQYGHNVVVDKTVRLPTLFPGGYRVRILPSPEDGGIRTVRKPHGLTTISNWGTILSTHIFHILVSSNGEFAYGFRLPYGNQLRQPRYSNTFIIYNKPAPPRQTALLWAVVDKNSIIQAAEQ